MIWRTKASALLMFGLTAGCSSPMVDLTPAETLRSVDGAYGDIEVYLPAGAGPYPVLLTPKPCGGEKMSVDHARLISSSLERGQAVIQPSWRCEGEPPRYAEFQKVMARVQAEAGRLRLNLDAMAIAGSDGP